MKIDIRKLKKQAKGITLVALVVTIIVMLILAGVALNFTLGEDGIFRRAEESSEIYQNASQNEKIELDKVTNYIDDILNGNKNDDEEETIYVKDVIKEGTVFENNTNIKDEYGNNIKVPAGFKLAEDSGETVLEGIVIEDVEAGDSISKGNQYVWVPVGEKIYINEQKDSKGIELGDILLM